MSTLNSLVLSLFLVTAPVLCFQGANDPVVSARFNRSHLEGRRNTRFVWIDEGYHDLALEPEVGGIDRIIEEKRNLADVILKSGESWLAELSTDQLRSMLTLSRDAVSEA